MDLYCYVFTIEPTRDLYVSVLDFCARFAGSMLLVVRDPGRNPGPEIREKIAALEDCSIGEGRAREWPGTTLLSDEATLYRYRVDEILIAKLKALAGGLFGWRHPHHPEDPCFFRADGSVLLVTISHERDAYFYLTQAEFDVLSRSWPEVEAILRFEGKA